MTPALRNFLVCVPCCVALIGSGCGPRDATGDPQYGNFSTVVGRWKTKRGMELLDVGNGPQGGLQIWTRETRDERSTAVTVLAALPAGTEISVEHLVVQPNFETGEQFMRTGSLTSGPYAGRTVVLDARLFAMNRFNQYGRGPAPAQLPGGWQVNPDQLGK